MANKINGRLTTDKWGKSMPAHNSIGGAPYYYRDTECVMVEFTTDIDYALDLMPPELEIIEPASAFMVIETNHWTTNWKGLFITSETGLFLISGSSIICANNLESIKLPTKSCPFNTGN